MDDYPEYRFACSQAQQYAWIKERESRALGAHPREGRRAGSSCPVGGSWVEPDCNLPSGESLVRQFLHGQRFFEARVRPPLHASSGARTRSATPASCRSSCARRASRASSRRSSRGTASTGPSTTRSPGRATTAARCSRTSRPRTPTTARRPCAELLKVAREYRTTSTRARACSSSATATAAAARRRTMLETLRRARDLQGPAAHAAARRASEFFDALEAEPRRAARRRRRAVLRVPPRRLHLAGVDEARQPPLRAGAARRRVPRRRARRRVSARRARPALEAAAAAAVPRHPPRLVDPARLRGRRARPRRGRGRRERALRRRRRRR